ncbi:MAG: ABC transporter ATP-binding protein [Desulfobacteraceae bacterium]|nr:MAG: ABC transporter ATP-binding protein [Desulfobacteraceae bacterium]
MQPIIEVKDLSRIFKIKGKWGLGPSKIVEALRGISFQVKTGEIFGLLGPNGAGKTTTLKILTTLLAPTNGQAHVLGFNTFGQEKQIRPRINFIFGGEKGFYWRLNAVETLTFFSDLYEIPPAIQAQRIPKLLDLVGLSAIDAKREIETYSKGMKQKVQIARGLVNDPEVIFYDEPSIGLDPVSAKNFREIVKQLASRGKTIILTTHYMAEAEELCDTIAVIDQGRILTCDSTANIVAGLSDESATLHVSVTALTAEKKSVLDRIRSEYPVAVTPAGEDRVDLRIHFPSQAAAREKSAALFSELEALELHIEKPTLEQAYLNLIQHRNPDGVASIPNH